MRAPDDRAVQQHHRLAADRVNGLPAGDHLADRRQRREGRALAVGRRRGARRRRSPRARASDVSPRTSTRGRRRACSQRRSSPACRSTRVCASLAQRPELRCPRGAGRRAFATRRRSRRTRFRLRPRPRSRPTPSRAPPTASPAVSSERLAVSRQRRPRRLQRRRARRDGLFGLLHRRRRRASRHANAGRSRIAKRPVDLASARTARAASPSRAMSPSRCRLTPLGCPSRERVADDHTARRSRRQHQAQALQANASARADRLTGDCRAGRSGSATAHASSAADLRRVQIYPPLRHVHASAGERRVREVRDAMGAMHAAAFRYCDCSWGLI